MKKEEIIKRYGEEAYEKQREQMQAWKKANLERVTANRHRWNKANPDKVAERSRNVGRKGGKYYQKALKYCQTGLPGERHVLRMKHAHMWRQYKNLIAPDSQLHHEWHPGTSEYDGVALVEKDQHMHGFIDVIEILEGEINVFREKELQGGLAI